MNMLTRIRPQAMPALTEADILAVHPAGSVTFRRRKPSLISDVLSIGAARGEGAAAHRRRNRRAVRS